MGARRYGRAMGNGRAWQDRTVVRWGVLTLESLFCPVGVVVAFTGRPVSGTLIVVGAVLLAALHVGYRPVTSDEREDIEGATLIHLTRERPVVDQRGEVFLDPQRCKIWSRALCASWPLLRRAAYAFRTTPTKGDEGFNVGGDAQWAVHFTPPPGARMLVRGQAVALLDGYRGPAVLEELEPSTAEHARSAISAPGTLPPTTRTPRPG